MSAPRPPGFVLARWELRPRDGGPPVRGDLRSLRGPPPGTAVVLCPGVQGARDWGFLPFLARAIAARGHAVLSFDPPGDADAVRSVLAAVRGAGLFPRPPRRVGLFGWDRGGGAALLAAAGDPRVDALVTWSVGADADSLRAAAAVAAPWLLVHGEDDAAVPAADAHALLAAARESAELLTVEGAAHAFGAAHPFQGPTPELLTAVDATAGWFAAELA